MGLNLALDMFGLWWEYEDREEEFCVWDCINLHGVIDTYLWDTDRLELTILDDVS